ncbi:uncharacterized protein BDR25DRAFT_292760 [Lindgomyces ingoldianus]|uniref:Uncharacterized protein n=1 Tax=Lindgomyces ingoldianus TaxID=673940 RepID=A0ACB6QLL6_9PLEO|nr:uncharacterized protein BDR25DRAFT_292760 [Lindgomyces ingoldianus]KAF2467015.1 hypothetical protein BDR25DRAFT_292760 [Lindgomyces ingoldianus]
MASGRDVRDMLGLPAAGDGQKMAVQKRPKPAAAVRKIQGVAREVVALYGERPPPVAVYEEKKTYRAKRQSTGPAKKWIQQPFMNQARNDGLVLKHWRRKPTATQSGLTNGEDTAMEDVEAAEPPLETNYDFAKFNVGIDIPVFTDEEYDVHLRSDDWSREETDYLLDMVKEHYYRWAVIWDRYDYNPSTKLEPFSRDALHGDPNQALATLPFAPSRTRSVEDLKARFYDISAKLMKLRIPEVQMDASQYARYEILTKFDPLLERNRKTLAAALMNRSMDEVKEEEFLLAELQRINMAANRLDAEREELRSRLEAPIPNQQIAAGLASFQSSAALAQLFQQLFQQDRSKKRASGTAGGPGRLSLSGADIIGTPTAAQHAQMNAAANRRQSLAQQPPPTPIRQLSPQAEYRFNVSTHDRLTSGVTFGADKLLKMRQAKSNVQTQKIGTALAQLGIPDIIPIPTSRLGEVFEALVSKVGKLLDVRKVREKEEGECRILEAMKERRANEAHGHAGHNGENGDANTGDGRGGTPATSTTNHREIQDSQERDEDAEAEADADEDGDVDADADDDDVDAEGEEDEDAEGEDIDIDSQAPSQSARHTSEAMSTRVISQGHKRSASVFSQTSNKSSKRARK